MNDMWIITAEIYLEIIELAQKHGKKQGDSMQEEFEEVKKKTFRNTTFRLYR